MAVLALTDAFCYVDLLDFTGQAEQLQVTGTAQQRPKTTFASGGWTEVQNTLKEWNLNIGAFWSCDSALDVDAQSFDGLGVANRVITTGLVETEGQPVVMMRGMQPSYTWLEGTVGDLAKAKVNAVGSDGGYGVVRGQLAVDYTTVTATGAVGTGLNLGAVGAAQSLYATFHVFGVPGTTITAIVESDDNSGFTTPTTRITLGPYTTAGGRWATPVAGAITDTWWRINITGITGTFVIAAAIAIQ